MGQAKLRGTYEQRSAQAEQREAEERAERDRKEAESAAAAAQAEAERVAAMTADFHAWGLPLLAISAAHGQGHEDRLRGFFDDTGHGLAPLMRCRDIQEDDLVRAVLVVFPGQLPGNSGISDLLELYALDDATSRHL